jgi:SAM-dependent methyltransferase
MDSYYASRFVPDKTRPIVWKEIIRHHQAFIPKNAVVVDLGAGYCDFINEVKAEKKYAVDHSPELKNFAHPDVICIQSGATIFKEIPDNSVDIVHASNLFEHLTDAELDAAMTEVKRVLKKGGKLILMQPNYYYKYRSYFDDPTHKKVFSHFALESFLVSYSMKIKLMKPKFLPFSLRSRPSIIPIHPLIIRAYINSPWKPFGGQMLFVAEK